MEILIQASQFLLSLSILIILHEFGHFLPAKLFGMRVEKFYLFFDWPSSLIKKKIGDTEYGIGIVPLGGYVKISGMIDESMDKEQMKKPAEDWEFRSKPAWQRLIVMVGGVTVNVILAALIYWMVLFVYGETYLPTKNVTYGITCDSLALEMGLQDGDKILTLDGQYVENFSKVPVEIILNEVKTIQVERNGQQVDVNIPDGMISKLMQAPGFVSVRIPFYVDRFAKESVAEEAGFQKDDKIIGLNDSSIVYFDAFKSALQEFKGQEVNVNLERNGEPISIAVSVPESGLLGVYPKGNMAEFFELEEIKYGFFESFPKGIEKAYNTLINYVKQLKLLFSPKNKGYESLGGFLTIGSIFTTTWDWHHFWNITAFLSILLAVMNILPIPALDGGHVVFLLYEMVTGRTPNEKVLEIAQMIGMVLLLALLLFANGNDIYKFFLK
ncbi:MAG: RIP metalloprotease RseP [Flavobacteriales bacterium]|nr:RIP metalloprotease RseP [Flavobacteriales bacterium]MCB9190324.1 RIP metalloprotease RseP [Flavobacteriales bacterium]